MPVYRVEATLHATAYIKARSPKHALAIAWKKRGEAIEAQDDGETFTGKQYADETLPDFSFSPAMTIARFSPFAEETES
jgi:hypothetical protein